MIQRTEDTATGPAVHNEAYFTELQSYVIAPETGVVQQFKFSGSLFDVENMRSKYESNWSTYCRLRQGSHSRPVTVTSTVKPGLSFRARLEIHNRKGALAVEDEDSWCDVTKWGATPFTDRVKVHFVLDAVDENDDLAEESFECEVTIIKWRIQGLQPGTELWVWQQDHCCNGFQAAIVTKTNNDNTFHYRLLNRGHSEALQHTINAHIGFNGKIFRLLPCPMSPPPPRTILIFGNDRKLRRADVKNKEIGLSHSISLETGETMSTDLHSFNHSRPLLTVHEFRRARLAYCTFLVKEKSTVIDGLTGRRLDIEKQLLNIGLGPLGKANPSAFSECSNAVNLAKKVWTIHNSTSRHHSGSVAHSPVVISSKAGCGKTWASHQMRYTIAQCIHTTNNRHGLDVPLLIPVQQLVGLVQDGGFTNLLHRYVERLTATDVGVDLRVTEMLQAAISLKSAILIVDGVDEAGDLSHQMEQFVLRDLICNGHTVVATSRPEGLRLITDPKYNWGISVLDLLPLTEEQQRQLIGDQTGQRSLIESLWGASEATKLLDKAWRRISNASPAVAEALQQRGSPNLKLYPCQQIMADSTPRTIRANRNQPASGIIVTLDQLFTASLLARLQDVVDITDDSVFTCLKQLSAVIANESVVALLQSPQRRRTLSQYGVLKGNEQSATKRLKRVTAWLRVVGTQLVLLCRRTGRSTSAVWNDIKTDTDELYQALEQHGYGVLLGFMRKLIDSCPDTRAALHTEDITEDSVLEQVGLNNNPVRLYEIAVEKYSSPRTNENLPTAYACNALQGTIVLVSLADILRLLEQWPMHGTHKDGTRISVQLLEQQNFFSTQCATPDPLRIRRVSCRIQLEYKGLEYLAELNIHHFELQRVKKDYKTPINRLMEYCRVRFRKTSMDKLRQLVETYRKLYADVAGNPVQVALLCHVMVHDATAEPPRTVLELYQKAMQSVLQQRLKGQWEKAMEILKALAVHLMLNEGAKRIFQRLDIVTAVGAEAWDWLLEISDRNVPLIKTLDVDRFEFQHRSFQEALLAEALSLQQGVPETEFMSAQNPRQNWEVIRSGTLANVWRIGGHSVVDVLKRGLGQSKGAHSIFWNKHVWSALFNCRVASYTLAFLTDLGVQNEGIHGSFHELSYFINVCSLVVVSKFSFAHRMHYTSLHHATHSVF